MKQIFALSLVFLLIIESSCSLRDNTDDIERYENLVKQMDKNGDGRLEIGEFESQNVPTKYREQVKISDLENQFYNLDLNCDGFVTSVEMLKVASQKKFSTCRGLR